VSGLSEAKDDHLLDGSQPNTAFQAREVVRNSGSIGLRDTVGGWWEVVVRVG